MDKKLIEFLKDPTTKQLLNIQDWEHLFLNATLEFYQDRNLIADLYNSLKQAVHSFNIPNDKKLYGIGKTLNRSTIGYLQINRKLKNNSYNAEFLNEIEPTFQVIMKGTFEEIFQFCLSKNNRLFPVSIDYALNDYVNVDIENYFIDEDGDKGEFFVSQEGLDYLKPENQKDRRILAAAKEEFNSYIKELLFKYVDKSKNKLREILNPYKQSEDDYIEITFKSNRYIISFNYDISKQSEILKLIKQTLNGPLNVQVHPINKDQFMITLNSKTMSKLKVEIEDMFDVSLN